MNFSPMGNWISSCGGHGGVACRCGDEFLGEFRPIPDQHEWTQADRLLSHFKAQYKIQYLQFISSLSFVVFINLVPAQTE
jgi:hypothetical protein